MRLLPTNTIPITAQQWCILNYCYYEKNIHYLTNSDLITSIEVTDKLCLTNAVKENEQSILQILEDKAKQKLTFKDVKQYKKSLNPILKQLYTNISRDRFDYMHAAIKKTLRCTKEIDDRDLGLVLYQVNFLQALVAPLIKTINLTNINSTLFYFLNKKLLTVISCLWTPLININLIIQWSSLIHILINLTKRVKHEKAFLHDLKDKKSESANPITVYRTNNSIILQKLDAGEKIIDEWVIPTEPNITWYWICTTKDRLINLIKQDHQTVTYFAYDTNQQQLIELPTDTIIFSRIIHNNYLLLGYKYIKKLERISSEKKAIAQQTFNKWLDGQIFMGKKGGNIWDSIEPIIKTEGNIFDIAIHNNQCRIRTHEEYITFSYIDPTLDTIEDPVSYVKKRQLIEKISTVFMKGTLLILIFFLSKKSPEYYSNLYIRKIGKKLFNEFFSRFNLYRHTDNIFYFFFKNPEISCYITHLNSLTRLINDCA